MQFRSVKGMNDILPEEIRRWHRLEHVFRRVVELHGYAEVRTPALEHTSLFVRSIGETTDVVEKEMYTLERGKESLTLRPEGTAGAARAYVEHAVHAREPVSRWYYIAPMFRAEQPQRGRYREFYQAGCEVFGDPGPLCDAEMIEMLVRIFGDVGVGELDVLVNSMGGTKTRERYRSALVEYLTPRRTDLSEHSQRRLELNPLRILDSKDERDRNLVASAPSILDHLEDDDRRHFEGVCNALDALGTSYRIEPGLVRGFDYYTRTLFEIRSSAGGLGTQNALVGGGRYDGMVKGLGGPQVPAIGFAMGLERILLALGAHEEPVLPFCYVAPIGERAQHAALRMARELRARGIRTDVDGRGTSLKSMLRRADGSGARVCVVIGDAELERGVVQMKDLRGHTQQELPVEAAVDHVAEHLRAVEPDATGEHPTGSHT